MRVNFGRSFRLWMASAILIATSSAQATVLTFESATATVNGIAGSGAQIQNGVLQTIFTGTNGFATVVGINAPLAGTAYAQQGDVTAMARAQLSAGLLKAYGDSAMPSPQAATQAYATARFGDAISFDNSSGHVAELQFSYSIDGLIYNPYGYAGGSQSISSSIELSNQSSNVGMKNVVGGVAPLGGLAFWNLNGSQYFQFISGGNFGQWDTTLNGDGAIIQGTLVIPQGFSTIDIFATLDAVCMSGPLCDYGHSSRFSFGALTDGLTWTSESGVFLTESDNQASSVAEPVTLALLGLGLVGVGFSRRRKA